VAGRHLLPSIHDAFGVSLRRVEFRFSIADDDSGDRVRISGERRPDSPIQREPARLGRLRIVSKFVGLPIRPVWLSGKDYVWIKAAYSYDEMAAGKALWLRSGVTKL